MLVLKNLSVSVASQPILNAVSLSLRPAALHVLMGPNGSGKSSLALTLMGHPAYSVTSGSLALNREPLLSLTPDQRAHLGLFLAFQTPLAIPGVSVQNALKTAYEAIHCSGCNLHPHCPKLSVTQFRTQLIKTAAILDLKSDFLQRSLNENFSGGEKKRLEMLTLLTLKPHFALIDEIDSGLDIDSIKLVAQAITHAVQNDRVGVLLITHYRRILDYLKPDLVSVLSGGRLVATGGPSLIDQIETHGYSSFKSAASALQNPKL